MPSLHLWKISLPIKSISIKFGPTSLPKKRMRNTPMADPALSLQGITCTFVSREDASKPYTAIADTTLDVAAGEFVSVVGPTGCGKSTLLNIGAGLLRPSQGQVKVFGQPLNGINRRAGYMFQGEALLPWRSALDNVTAGLEFAGVARNEAVAQAREWL